MDISQLDERLKQVELIIASDVNNPLTGLQGAAHVFAPQKGATPDMVLQLDAGLQHFASLIKQQLGLDISHIAGAGAAGGLGAGLLAFAGARMTSGVQLVIGLVGLVQQMARADYVFTGEGGIDYQTSFGKTLLGVAQVAKQLNKPVFACAGYVGEGIDSLYTEGFTAIFGILDKSGDLQQALADGEKNLGRTCENIARVLASV
jgi:glycerate kinase